MFRSLHMSTGSLASRLVTAPKFSTERLLKLNELTHMKGAMKKVCSIYSLSRDVLLSFSVLVTNFYFPPRSLSFCTSTVRRGKGGVVVLVLIRERTPVGDIRSRALPRELSKVVKLPCTSVFQKLASTTPSKFSSI